MGKWCRGLLLNLGFGCLPIYFVFFISCFQTGEGGLKSGHLGWLPSVRSFLVPCTALRTARAVTPEMWSLFKDEHNMNERSTLLEMSYTCAPSLGGLLILCDLTQTTPPSAAIPPSMILTLRISHHIHMMLLLFHEAEKTPISEDRSCNLLPFLHSSVPSPSRFPRVMRIP